LANGWDWNRFNFARTVVDGSETGCKGLRMGMKFDVTGGAELHMDDFP